MSAGKPGEPRAGSARAFPSIALLTYSTKPRGGVVHTVELGEALHDLGAEVCVYALDKDLGGFYRPLRCPYRLVPTRPAGGGIDAVVAQRIAEFIAGLQGAGASHDIWHAQDCISAHALLALREEGRIPRFLRTVHHLDDYESAYLRACQERSVREADLCVAVSAAWQAALRDGFGVHAPIVPNGVSARRFSPDLDGREAALRERFSIRACQDTGAMDRGTHVDPVAEAPVFLTVGGVEPRKNSIQLLRAFLVVRRRLPGAQLVIAGGETLFDYEPYQREFAAIAEEAGLFRAGGGAPPLVLAGVLPDELMPPLYRVADAFVFPSVREGWGLALLEAMASGIPVIASAQPPFTEFLADRESALLVDPHHPEAIAGAMEEIVHHRALRQRLKGAAREVAALYTWERSARIAASVYDEFLSR